MAVVIYSYYCPRCDRKTESEISWDDAEQIVKDHVKKAHPDHDPDWFDTYPEIHGN